jgi:hypothetical protein
MKKVLIEIKVDGELKRFYLTICSSFELQKIEQVIENEIASHQ